MKKKANHFMSGFDKVCAVCAIPVGLVFLVLGVIGLFAGSHADFTLPPVIGVLPFFLGWAMSVTLIRYWGATNRESERVRRSTRERSSRPRRDRVEIYEGSTDDVHRLQKHLRSRSIEALVVFSGAEGSVLRSADVGSVVDARLAVIGIEVERARQIIQGFGDAGAAEAGEEDPD